MRLTTLGHAGLHIDTGRHTILCDPWVNPAFFASWFPYPDNSRLDWPKYGDVDLLYVSHLHRDHFDPRNLAENVSRDATVLLPDYPTDDLRRELTDLGFQNFRRVPAAERVEHDGTSLMIIPLTAPNDGAVGDSALVVDDGTACILNQNDAKLTDLEPLREFGVFDAHFLQFSGANWWPGVYRLPDRAKRSFGAKKRANALARALRFARSVNARHVIPFAGPACFLDDDLFALNDVHNDEANIFPDHTVFLDYLQQRGFPGGLLMAPGTVLELTRSTHELAHLGSDAQAMEPFVHKERYLRRYAKAMQHRIAAERASWAQDGVDILARLKEWFEPLMASASHVCDGIGSSLLLWVDKADSVVLDFPQREVRRYSGDNCRYAFWIERDLLQKLIADREVDWVNSLFLSMRFEASRVGPYNEHLYAFFTCLSPERMNYAESYYANRGTNEDDIFVGGWRVQRRCPHRDADLTRFGELDRDVLTCTMHGWRFDLTSGRCLTAAGHDIRCSSAEPQRREYSR